MSSCKNASKIHRKKNAARCQQLEADMQAAQSKASNLEKLKNRLNGEVEDLTSNVENVSAHLSHWLCHLDKNMLFFLIRTWTNAVFV